MLERRHIAFLERPKRETVLADCSGNEYHRIVTRARCIQKSREDKLPAGTTYYIEKIYRKGNGDMVKLISSYTGFT